MGPTKWVWVLHGYQVSDPNPHPANPYLYTHGFCKPMTCTINFIVQLLLLLYKLTGLLLFTLTSFTLAHQYSCTLLFSAF